MTKHTNKWDIRWLELARLISSWSKDPSSQVGAIIVSPHNRLISTGYNGFSEGIADDDRLDNREEKYKLVIHAEINSILNAFGPVRGNKIYIYPYLPCFTCASIIINSGLIEVNIPYLKDEQIPLRWVESWELSKKLFKEANVLIKTHRINSNDTSDV